MGFTKPTSHLAAGALLPHRFILTTAYDGGLFSVALSLRSPSLAVSKHPALRSPDFPQPCGRDHFTYSFQYQYDIISQQEEMCYRKSNISQIIHDKAQTPKTKQQNSYMTQRYKDTMTQ